MGVRSVPVLVPGSRLLAAPESRVHYDHGGLLTPDLQPPVPPQHQGSQNVTLNPLPLRRHLGGDLRRHLPGHLSQDTRPVRHILPGVQCVRTRGGGQQPRVGCPLAGDDSDPGGTSSPPHPPV